MGDLEAAIDLRTDRYRDVIDTLNGQGLPTIFTQTGGIERRPGGAAGYPAVAAHHRR